MKKIIDRFSAILILQMNGMRRNGSSTRVRNARIKKKFIALEKLSFKKMIDQSKKRN